MIALPFHPSNVWEIDALLENPGDILRQVEIDGAALIENPKIRFNLTGKIDGQGHIRVDQGIIAGCAGGTFDNITAAAAILEGDGPCLGGAGGSGGGGSGGPGAGPAAGNEQFSLSVYPGSQPVLLELARNGTVGRLISRGVLVRTAFCGPCFGAGDVPANNGLSIRHTTRNFPNREGSKPVNGQISSVCLMDARSIAATARRGGVLSSAEFTDPPEKISYRYDDSPYKARVYHGAGRPEPEAALQYGPNITDWPDFPRLGENLLVKIISFITDPVTTTDEIIPSGETSSYRSNPLGLAEFTLSRKDPSYVEKAKQIRGAEEARRRAAGRGKPEGGAGTAAVLQAEFPELAGVFANIRGIPGFGDGDPEDIQIGSAIYALKPGDGSAREQAASCQRVLGGAANFAREYATKRYRSNLINWGILPFILLGPPPFKKGDYVFLPRIAGAIRNGAASLEAYVVEAEPGLKPNPYIQALPELDRGERDLILEGCLINYNRIR
jgi:aconitate hydratase